MSISSIINLITTLNKTYKDVEFTYYFYYDEDDGSILKSLETHNVNVKRKAVV